jgi:5-methyltetrahydrofolate--homocysteine methyltransferase
MTQGEILKEIERAVSEGLHDRIEGLIEEALKEGIPARRIIGDALISAMDMVGERFSRQEIYVPEMLVSAHTMKRGLEILKPLLKGRQAPKGGTIIMATVKGDLHDIGKNLVIMMLEGAGFEVVDMGVNVDVSDVVEKVSEVRPDVLGLSALLTTTMPEMARVIEVLKERGLRENVKVMVGGAPVDRAFAERIGADGYGQDATEAVRLAREFTTRG